MLETARKVLKKYYGYDEFRPGQAKVITSLLGGKDTLAIMPTGAGKSLCFQVPAIFLAWCYCGGFAAYLTHERSGGCVNRTGNTGDLY